MFRIPASILTDQVTIKTTVYTGFGEQKTVRGVYPARVTTQQRWSGSSDGALTQDVTTVLTHVPVSAGYVFVLPSGAEIEVKSVLEVRYCRRIVGYESSGW